MINTVYRLCSPRRFEIAFEDIGLDGVIVRPTHLSICNADQRYYQGTRDIKVLREKLPMALIHEGIGQVVFDPTGSFTPGDRVVMIPNLPCEQDDCIAENYLRSSKFCGSSMDGFMQEYYKLQPERIVRLPLGIDLNVAAFTELVSVSVHAISRFQRFSHERRDRLGVWGDGNLAYITSLLLKKMQPRSEIYIFGISREKLSDFSFADGTYLTSDIPADMQIDHAFECVGGNGSPVAIPRRQRIPGRRKHTHDTRKRSAYVRHEPLRQSGLRKDRRALPRAPRDTAVSEQARRQRRRGQQIRRHQKRL